TSPAIQRSCCGDATTRGARSRSAAGMRACQRSGGSAHRSRWSSHEKIRWSVAIAFPPEMRCFRATSLAGRCTSSSTGRSRTGRGWMSRSSGAGAVRRRGLYHRGSRAAIIVPRGNGVVPSPELSDGRRMTMSSTDPTAIPDVGELLAPVLARVSREQRPLLLAIAERLAAERYRGWAEDPANASHAAALHACAGREQEIAQRIEALHAGAAALQDAILADNPDLADVNRTIFA